MKDQFFHPIKVWESGVGPFLKGLTVKPQNRIGPNYVDGVRKYVNAPFREGGSHFGLDLAALDIRRGREHGIQVSLHEIHFNS
jgi:hypothetical protein